MWYALFPIYDDGSIYMDKTLYPKYYCQNKKCNRILYDFEGKWLRYPVLKHDCMVLSQMNMYLISDNLVNLLNGIGCKDFYTRRIQENINVLYVTATCELREDLMDELSYCPQCGNPLSITFSRGFNGGKTSILRMVHDKNCMLCRSKYRISDSTCSIYQLFVREDLAKILKKLKCFTLCECKDVENTL